VRSRTRSLKERVSGAMAAVRWKRNTAHSASI
jgi:hypothetical protein